MKRTSEMRLLKAIADAHWLLIGRDESFAFFAPLR